MSLPDDENYPRTTTTSAQSFLSCEAELHSVSTHTTGQKRTAIPLLHTECWAAGLRGPARCWRGQGGEGETRRGDYLSKLASESNENPREGERNPPPSLLRGAAAAAGPPPPPPRRRRRGDNITTIIRAGRGAGSSSVSSSVQRTCRAGGCAAEANPFPPSLLHNINTGRAAPRRTGSEPRSEPGRAEGGRGAALPRGRRRRRRSLRECEGRRAGRSGLGTVSRYRAGGQGERRARRRRRGKDPVCVSLAPSQNKMPTGSAAAGMTPSTGAKHQQPPPSLHCLLLARSLPRSTSAASAAAAGGDPLPRLSRHSLACVAPLPSIPLRLLHDFLIFLFLFPSSPRLLVRGTRPKFTLKPALRIYEGTAGKRIHVLVFIFLFSLSMVVRTRRRTAKCCLAGGRPGKGP
ncbi:uncharacterized protein LOC134057005 [Cinclus cinclus]|uniref:uncharacterized protein LOC134057005 n=1 Tax=Cinclus cinclus TaxID=127875 RepID=UPI002E0F7700